MADACISRPGVIVHLPHLNFSPDGEYFFYPDAGRVLRKCFLDTDRLIELAESRATRSLTDDECLRHLDALRCG